MPSPLALEYAEDVSRRVHGRSAPVRVGFIERLPPREDPPPLAQLLRGGQGGEVRIKLLLSMLWFSAGPPHDTSYPARGWAGLLDLPEYETNGARRVSAAITWLTDRRFLRTVQHPGRPSEVFLLDERGNGDDYVLPGTALGRAEAAGESISRDHYWVELPAHFWTKGWLAVLTGPAVAMLLLLLDETFYKRRLTDLWIAPSQAQQRFALSPDTRTAGLQELERYELVKKNRRSITPGVFDFRRMRNVYTLRTQQLAAGPGVVVPAQNSSKVSDVVAKSLLK